MQENQALIGQEVSTEVVAKQQAAAAAEAQAAAARKQEEADRAARLGSWGQEEIRLLEKALAKYPVVRAHFTAHPVVHCLLAALCSCASSSCIGRRSGWRQPSWQAQQFAVQFVTRMQSGRQTSC